jgi:hypothetical protein
LRGQTYYVPSGRGYEKIVKERLEKWNKIRRAAIRDSKKREP